MISGAFIKQDKVGWLYPNTVPKNKKGERSFEKREINSPFSILSSVYL